MAARIFLVDIVFGRWAYASIRMSVLAASVLVASGCSISPAALESTACVVSDADRAWVERSLEAWRLASRQIIDVASMPHPTAVFFDASCVLTSDDALTANMPVDRVSWAAVAHSGTIVLPDGDEMPAGVTSFASGGGASTYFVMSTPSLWAAAGVNSGAIPLDTMMAAVFLHEASHIAQAGPFRRRLDLLIEQNELSEDFNDDSLQRRFRGDAAFVASIQRETDLFFQASVAPSIDEARRLAREARELMRARAQRWYVGSEAYWTEAEEIWLTFEGAGQWVAYQWLVHPLGGATPPEETARRLLGDRSWSQGEGFAVVSALHRIMGSDWRAHAYGDGSPLTVIEMLDAALVE